MFKNVLPCLFSYVDSPVQEAVVEPWVRIPPLPPFSHFTYYNRLFSGDLLMPSAQRTEEEKSVLCLGRGFAGLRASDNATRR